jgi:hypothetical protein
VARTDSIRGNWFQVTKGSESTSTGIRSNVSLLSDFGVVPGDTLEAALEFQVSGMNPSPTLKGNPGLVIQYLDNANTNISSNTFMNVVTTDDIATSDRSGMYYLRSVVPATVRAAPHKTPTQQRETTIFRKMGCVTGLVRNCLGKGTEGFPMSTRRRCRKQTKPLGTDTKQRVS